MSKVEFYKKWGNSETLKILINILILNIVDGSFNDYVTNYDELMFLCEQHGILDISFDAYVKIRECLQDLRQLPYSVVKNVFRKVL